MDSFRLADNTPISGSRTLRAGRPWFFSGTIRIDPGSSCLMPAGWSVKEAGLRDDLLTVYNCRQSRHMAKPTDLVQGTLDLLILKTISLEPKHGWAIAKRIQQISQEALQIQQGSLYPALHRLEQQAWIKAEWRPTETGRMAKFYSLTRSGRKQLERELANWVRLSTAINIVVQEA
jgi:PadR family transcriptional regulator PadR